MSGTAVPGAIFGGDGIDISPEGRISAAASLIPKSWFAELAEDTIITDAAPTAPFAFPAGQPATLVSVDFTAREGQVLISGSFNGFLQANDPDEINPTLWLQFWLDGVHLPLSDALVAVSWNSATPNNLEALTAEATMIKMLAVTEGTHTLDLRWGLLGGVPDVIAGSLVSGGNHCSLLVQEVTAG